jgi:cell division protein FtsZ
VIDDALGDEVRVTVIAAGFDGGMPKRRDAGQPALRRDKPAPPPPAPPPQAPPVAATFEPSASTEPAASNADPGGAGPERPAAEPREPARPAAPAQPVRVGAGRVQQRSPKPSEDDELDVPDFLK